MAHGRASFRERVDELRAEGADEDAEDCLHDLLYSDDERVRLGAAQGLLRLLPKRRADDPDDDSDLDSGW